MITDPNVTYKTLKTPQGPGFESAKVPTDACLVFIYPKGPDMGARYVLRDFEAVVGRTDDCAIRNTDASVSRLHARIERRADGYYAVDLGSTNGTFINNVLKREGRLEDGDYLRIGNCIYRFLAGGNIEAEYHEEIYRLTIIDGLTQIHNHRYLAEFLDREVARAQRHERPLSVLMFDLDKFKTINDQFGHLCGDYVLRELSNRIRHSVRREDLFARYGGEEFTLVLVETNLEQALEVAERLRQGVADKPFWFESMPVPVTVSLGVATLDHANPVSAEQLLKTADENLYKAKRGGRNRVVA